MYIFCICKDKGTQPYTVHDALKQILYSGADGEFRGHQTGLQEEFSYQTIILYSTEWWGGGIDIIVSTVQCTIRYYLVHRTVQGDEKDDELMYNIHWPVEYNA